MTTYDYKNFLIDTYCYECDNNDKMRQQREMILSKKYNDELLNKIVNDTKTFIIDIFNSKTIDSGYCTFELEEDTTSYISLGLSGGWFSDRLFVDINGRIISEYILKKFFGKQFMIYVKEEENQFETEDNIIIGIEYIYSLYMQGFPENINEIKEKLFEKTKKIVKYK